MTSKSNRLLRQIAITVLIASAVIPLNLGALANTRDPAAKQNHRMSRQRLRELGNISQLKEAFQSDAGKVRLVVLVSPT